MPMRFWRGLGRDGLVAAGLGNVTGADLTGSRFTSAAGFTPADIAACAAAAESGGCGSAPRKSGFTMICRS